MVREGTFNVQGDYLWQALHYPCTDGERGDHHCPGGLLLAGIDAAALSMHYLAMHCQMLRGEGPSVFGGTACGRHGWSGGQIILAPMVRGGCQ